MNLTRENHMNYMTKVTPFLILACVIQSFIYPRFVPGTNSLEIALFLFIGIVLIVGAFSLYDWLHRVTVYRNFMTVSFSPFSYHEEILYQDIEEVTVKTSKK